MNKDKKVKEVVILVLLLAVLVVAAVIQFSGRKLSASPTTAPKSSTDTSSTQSTTSSTNTVSATSTSSEESKVGDLSWIDGRRLPTIVAEVAHGRDPFCDPFAAADAKAVPSSTPTPTSTPSKPGMGSSAVQATSTVLPSASEHLGRIGAVAQEQTPPFVPPPPPPPNFVLMGIVSTSRDRYAAITVDGHYYTLLEGESIPTLGWTVEKIGSYSVLMKKGSQTISLRLSGGSSK